jgi:hypothetical protein
MLLDEADFEVEQTYHRERLSMITRYLHGTGTVCGLNVEVDPVDTRRIIIQPGLGVDRAGRVIQSPLMLCMDVDRWYDDFIEEDSARAKQSFKAGTDGAPDHLTCDIFLGFRECKIAKRPAFESGEFDALGSVAPLRLRDAVEANLVIRTENDPPLPRAGLPAVTGATFAARRKKLDTQKRSSGWLEDIWWDDFDSEIAPDQEHTQDTAAADVFLARIKMPATNGTPPTLNDDIALDIDNSKRRMVYSTADLIALGK